MRIFAITSAVLGIPQMNTESDLGPANCPERPPLVIQSWTSGSIDQYLGNLDTPFPEYVATHSTYPEPCRTGLNDTDWLVLTAAENYKKYALDLIGQLRLAHHHNQTPNLTYGIEVVLNERPPHRLPKLAKRGPEELTSTGEVLQAASYLVESQKSAIVDTHMADLHASQLPQMIVPNVREIPTLPTPIIRFQRYLTETGRNVKERGKVMLRKTRIGSKQSRYPVPLHTQRPPPSLLALSPDVQELVNSKAVIEEKWLDAYLRIHATGGQHDSGDLKLMSKKLTDAASRWKQIDDKQQAMIRKSLFNDAESLLSTFNKKVEAQAKSVDSAIGGINVLFMEESDALTKYRSLGYLQMAFRNDNFLKMLENKKFSPKTALEIKSPPPPAQGEFETLQNRLLEAQNANVFPKAVIEPEKLPSSFLKIQKDGQFSFPFEASKKSSKSLEEAPEVPPARLSYATSELLKTRSANLAYKMNLLQTKWTKVFDQLYQYERSNSKTTERLKTIKQLSLFWNDLDTRYRAALKEESIKAVFEKKPETAQTTTRAMNQARQTIKNIDKVKVEKGLYLVDVNPRYTLQQILKSTESLRTENLKSSRNKDILSRIEEEEAMLKKIETDHVLSVAQLEDLHRQTLAGQNKNGPHDENPFSSWDPFDVSNKVTSKKIGPLDPYQRHLAYLRELSQAQDYKVQILEGRIASLKNSMKSSSSSAAPQGSTNNKVLRLFSSRQKEQPSSTNALVKRQLKSFQETMIFSSVRQENRVKTTPPSEAEFIISRQVKEVFSSPINSSHGMITALKGGLFVSTESNSSIEEDVKSLKDFITNSKNLKNLGFCLSHQDQKASDILNIRKKSGCLHVQTSWWIQTPKGDKILEAPETLIKNALRCQSSSTYNSAPTHRWEIFLPCQLNIPLC